MTRNRGDESKMKKNEKLLMVNVTPFQKNPERETAAGCPSECTGKKSVSHQMGGGYERQLSEDVSTWRFGRGRSCSC